MRATAVCWSILAILFLGGSDVWTFMTVANGFVEACPELAEGAGPAVWDRAGVAPDFPDAPSLRFLKGWDAFEFLASNYYLRAESVPHALF
jgi:hypothetical protein